MRLSIFKRLLGYRLRVVTEDESPTELFIQFPRWYPDSEIARKVKELAISNPMLKVTLSDGGREVHIQDRATELLKRIREAQRTI